MNRRLRFAIPNKGRLLQPCIELLESIDIKIIKNERSYIQQTNNPSVDIVLTRAYDIPMYVENGAVDLGITGYDLVIERKANLHILWNFNFGKCQLVVAVPEESPTKTMDDIKQIARISTEYPHISSKYFQTMGKQVEILEVRGATELAPKLGLTEIIVDITSSGETLKKNNLRVISTILSSTSILVCNKLSYRLFQSEISSLLQKIRIIGGYEN